MSHWEQFLFVYGIENGAFIEFIPGSTLAWATMADAGHVFVFDWSTALPVDTDATRPTGTRTSRPASTTRTAAGW